MYYTEGNYYSTLRGIEAFLGSGIASVAVPLFYVMSGYLFFWNVLGDKSKIYEKIKKRYHSLFIPYILANIFTFVFYLLLNLICIKIPTIGGVVNFKVITVIQNQSILETLKLIFITPPIAFQLWFVRDLMVVMCFSPLLYYIIGKLIGKKCINPVTLCILLVACLICFGKYSLLRAFIWFTVGGVFAICYQSQLVAFKSGKRTTKALISIYLLSCLSCCIFKDCKIIVLVIPVIGIPALWFTYDCLYPKIQKVTYLAFFEKYTFFVYLVHEPFLNIFKKIPLVLSRNESVTIFSYMIMPIMFFIVAGILGKWLRKLYPKVYTVYTGGR